MSFFALLEAQRTHLFTWSPVALGAGIGVYFALPAEPAPWALGLIAAMSLTLIVLFARRPGGGAVLVLAGAVMLAGLALAGTRSLLVAGPVLSYHYYGPIEGRVVKVDRSQSDAVRLTLDHVRLTRMAPERVPRRVRISLHGTQGFIDPVPGLTVALTGHLDGPGGPVEPGGFDFQRMAWFDGIGAVGYTRSPVLLMEPAGRGLGIARLRARISDWVRTEMPGKAGAFAAAVMTGDRSALPREELRDLRRSNLAHLLAISGLHMGMLTGFVFAAFRLVLAMIPAIALRFPVHKIAAVIALMAGAFYLALSGGNVATQRAYIMVAAMLLAVILDRRALTLRSVALAALIVLILHPEALTGPGFQMSFAATTALVAAFRVVNDGWAQRLPRWLRPLMALVLSSAVAGAATAPFAAAHFNQIAFYGLPANLLAVPAMGFVVMPAAVLAALLAPFGLAHLALSLMRPAVLWILNVAETVSGLDGAVRLVPTPQGFVLPLIALGGLFVILWKGQARWAGAGLMAVALVAWNQVSRPDLLIAASGRLVGVMTEGGRVLSRERGESFAARAWLENDGDGAGQKAAATRAGWQVEGGVRIYSHRSGDLVALQGRDAAQNLGNYCTGGKLVVTTAEAPASGMRDCLLFDALKLEQTGSVALFADGAEWRMAFARDEAGNRPWNAAGRSQRP